MGAGDREGVSMTAAIIAFAFFILALIELALVGWLYWRRSRWMRRQRPPEP